MPILFIIVGFILLGAVIKGDGSLGKVTTQFQRDIFGTDESGNGGFLLWVFGIGAVSAIGFIPGPNSKKISNAFLLLIFLVLVIGKPAKDGRNLFSSFRYQLTGK